MRRRCDEFRLDENMFCCAKKVNLFDAIMWLRSAWDSLLPTTIKKCFANCGIGVAASSSPEENDDTAAMDETTEENLLPVLDGLSLQEFADHDDDLATSREGTTASGWEQQLVKRAQEGHASDSQSREEEPSTPIDEEDEAQPSVITVHDAARMVEGLKRFGLENDKPELVEAMLRFEGTVQQVKFDKIKKSKQSTITNFFS